MPGGGDAGSPPARTTYATREQAGGAGTVGRAARREAGVLRQQPGQRLFAVLLGLLGAVGVLVASDPAKGCAPAAPVSRDGAPLGPATPRPTAPGGTCATRPPSDRNPSGGTQLPTVAPEPGQPAVARKTATLTGSAVTMTGLRIEGITELPTADGTVKALKFGMSRADMSDVLLRSPGPGGRNLRFTADRLAVQGDVALYATRFIGLRSGVPITLSPDLPLPDGLPTAAPGPVTFTDPAIDLVFLRAGTVTAHPRLTLSLTGE